MTTPSPSELSPELKSLLRDQAHRVPHRDLEDGFLQDLHARIQEEEVRQQDGRMASPMAYFRLLRARMAALSGASLGWGSATVATAVVAIGMGLFLADRKDEASFAEAHPSLPTLTYVKADERVDTSGTIPAFLEEPIEF